MKRSVKSMFGQRFRAGSYATFAAVIVIAIAIMANALVGALPASLTQWDMTAQNLYSLSEQSKRIVSSLDQQVDIYLLANEGSEDPTIVRLLDRYAGLSDKIRLSTVDPTVKPTFLDQYGLSVYNIYANSVLVVSGEQHRLVSYNDIYVTSYVSDQSSYYGYSTVTEFGGEAALTNAIHYVSSKELPVIYTLSGHGESALEDYVTEMMEQDNMQVKSLSLLTLDAVPEDADAIIVNAPSTDLSADEAAMLKAWMQAGGRMVLITEQIDVEKMTNLLDVTSVMGLTAQNGLIIEGDSQMHISRYPHYMLPDVTVHAITDAITSAGYYILTPLAQPLAQTEGSSASVTWLLNTSDEAYAKPQGLEATTTEQEDGDIEGPFNIAAASELGEGRLVWLSSAEMLNSQVDAMVSYANSNLFVNAVNWMCDQAESISIRAKSLDTGALTISSSESSFWSMVIVGFIPAALIVIGVIVCIRRKRK